MARETIQQTNLGQVLQDHAYVGRKTSKALAEEIGISPGVLRGVAEGRLPDGHTTKKLLEWLLAPAGK